MNLFFLHLDPAKSAAFYYNKHCIKIILEITQMLYCAHWLAPGESNWIMNHQIVLSLKPYCKTHHNYPTTKWIRQHVNNYKYACRMAAALCREYTRRYHKVHKCAIRVRWLSWHIPRVDYTLRIDNSFLATKNIPAGCTPVPLAMPAEYHSSDLIGSYRSYYIYSKQSIAQSRAVWEELQARWGLNSPTLKSY